MSFSRIITGILFTTILFAQADKGKEQSRPTPKKYKNGFVDEPLINQSHIQDLINSGTIANISGYSHRNHYSNSNPTGDEDIIIEQGISIPARRYNSNRNLADTLTYYPEDGTWNGQFIMSPGDAMLMTFKMPTEGIIKGINIPIYEWWTGNHELTVSLHKLQYPYDINGEEYSSSMVDGYGWIGGYDLDSTGAIYISGDVYTPGGTQGICDSTDFLQSNITDPLLASEPGVGPPNVPPQGVVWPDSNNVVIMTPHTHPDYTTSSNLNNWIDLQNFGVEYEFLNSEWIGILFQYTGAGGGDDEPVGFFYEEGSGVVDPRVFLKFYDDCGGISGNGGWHIRHWMIRTELAVELTGDRGPFFEDVSELNTGFSIEDRTVTAHITDDNPSGGGIGIVNQGSPLLQNVTVSGNMANWGGGIYCNGSSPTLENVNITSNTSANNAGGIYCFNSSSPILTDVIISSNTAGGTGGGIFAVYSSSPILTDVIISSNTAGDGGGMAAGAQSNAVLSRVLISGNTAIVGGAFRIESSNVTFTNVTMYGNVATSFGDGIYVWNLGESTTG